MQPWKTWIKKCASVHLKPFTNAYINWNNVWQQKNIKFETMHTPVKIGYMWPLSLKSRWAWGCAYRGKHGARHWRNKTRDKIPLPQLRLGQLKHLVYLSVRLRRNSRAFCRLFDRSFLFSSGFGELCSHASGATKETQPIKWLNKDRKLPPRKKNVQVERRHLLLPSEEKRNAEESGPKWPQQKHRGGRARSCCGGLRKKMWRRRERRKREFFQFFLSEPSL